MKYKILLVIIALLAVSSGVYAVVRSNTPSFEQKRAGIIRNLDKAIAQAKESGDYRCCIEPACRMCYLGNWIFEDGKCGCDDLVREGKTDQVCPECKRGIEEGRCESTKDFCSVEI